MLKGEPYEPISPKHAQELGISIIHQEFNLMPDLTVAQNIFIGREPRSPALPQRAPPQRAGARAHRAPASAARPKQLVGNLTVAKQQMVEIGKALSYDAKLLIMDEPTAALNDAEVAVLHGLIRRFVQPDTGVIYISHRMDEIKRIADRVTVIRDGRYVGTRETSDTTMKEVISMMVGREISGEARPVGVRGRSRGGARGLRAEHQGTAQGRDLRAAQGRDPRLRGTDGRRAYRGGARSGRRGQDRRRDHQAARPRDPLHNPAAAAKHRIGYLSEDRKQFGLLVEQEVNANIGLSALRERFQSFGFVKDRAMRAMSREYVGMLSIKTPSVAQTVKNLSGGNQQKVVIAKWLVKDCDILIFDEPTRGIDVGAKEEIYRLLNELAQQGKSVIMISSELPEILRMAHRIVVMSEGRVTGELDAEDATQESVMHYATLRPDENPEDAAELGLAEAAGGHDGGADMTAPVVTGESQEERTAVETVGTGLRTGSSSSSPSRA